MSKIEFAVHKDFPLPLPETRQGVLEVLDKYFPNITDQIDVDNLYMTDVTECVLGQTVGWANGYEIMFGGSKWSNNNYSLANGTPEWKQAVLDYRANKTKFCLKTMPWFIKVDNDYEREAAQEWLFSQGLEWERFNTLIRKGEYVNYLTNTFVSGKAKPFILWGSGQANPSCKEIKLTYKTNVAEVEWPELDNPNAAKIEKVKAKIAKLQAKLKELES